MDPIDDRQNVCSETWMEDKTVSQMRNGEKSQLLQFEAIMAWSFLRVTPVTETEHNLDHTIIDQHMGTGLRGSAKDDGHTYAGEGTERSISDCEITLHNPKQSRTAHCAH